ncbi:TIGR02444 family protein [Vineibacter terrae]|uniref:TIGR02444 family protein n=1 Tax=Vineibacter terrae TaxID=2586908 RepID=A0A5C8PB81_9HYPH|nr:TIGR02444 family protein [Vineibacter terrae]TXL71062.1 TIGR02444 family protein [Vineibacter terrae]
MSDFLPHPFWNFSLEVYGADGVAASCLALQERRRTNVNVLLLCVWLGASGRGTLTVDRLKALLAEIEPWQAEIVQRARAMRRRIKDGDWPGAPPETIEAARRRIAEAELAAEHVEQLMLAAHWPFPGDRDRPLHQRLRAAVGNLGVYAVCLGVTPDARDRESLLPLVAAAFPTLHGLEVERALGIEA